MDARLWREWSHKPTVCPGSKEVSSILCCINGSMARRGREVIIALYSALISLPMPPTTKYRKDMDKPEQAQWRATRFVRARVLTYEERLRDWDFFSLGKRWLQGGLTADPLYPASGEQGWQDDRAGLLWWCMVGG